MTGGGGGGRNNFWGAQKLFSSNLRVKTYKKKVLVAKSAKKRFLPTNSGEDQSFESVAPSLLLYFGAQSSLGGVTSSDLGDTASTCPQWGRACLDYFTIKKAFNSNFEKRKKILKKSLPTRPHWNFCNLSARMAIRYKTFRICALRTSHLQSYRTSVQF